MYDFAATEATLPGDLVDLIVTTAHLPGWLAPGLADGAGILDAARSARRLTIHVVVHRATDAVLGLTTSDGPSEVAAVTALRMAMSDKAEHARRARTRLGWDVAARPATVVVDANGTLPTPRLRDGLLSLGVSVVSRAGVPPRYEELADCLDDVLRTAPRPRIDLEGVSFAVADVAQQAFVRWAVDEHNVAPDVHGSTPAKAWKRLVDAHGIPTLPDRDELRHAMGTEVRGLVENSGISLFGLYYQDQALRDAVHLRGPFAARVRYDGADVGRVSVEVDGVWTSVRCATSGLDGKSLRTSCDWAIEAPRRFPEAEPSRPASSPMDADGMSHGVRRLSLREVDAARTVPRPLARSDAGVVLPFPDVRHDDAGRLLDGLPNAPSRDGRGDA